MPGPEKKLLIITETDKDTNELYSEVARNGFDFSIAHARNGVIDHITDEAPDLVVLEIDRRANSPAIWELAQKIKQAKPLPVIALVSKETIGNLDANLKLVDDFLFKPGDASELLLRVKRLIEDTGSKDKSERIECSDLVVDLVSCEVTLNGRLIELTFKEYELLRFLASHPGRVYTRDSLLSRVWGYDYFGGDRTVDVHIRRLRSKIEDATHTFIETVRNIGYRFKCNA